VTTIGYSIISSALNNRQKLGKNSEIFKPPNDRGHLDANWVFAGFLMIIGIMKQIIQVIELFPFIRPVLPEINPKISMLVSAMQKYQKTIQESYVEKSIDVQLIKVDRQWYIIWITGNFLRVSQKMGIGYTNCQQTLKVISFTLKNQEPRSFMRYD
jgi:hypothetical protein